MVCKLALTLNSIVNAFHPVLARQAGLSLTQIGALSSIRSWASASSRLGSGPIFQRFNAAGLTLPLVSAGGSSMMSVFLGLGLAASVSMRRGDGELDIAENPLGRPLR